MAQLTSEEFAQAVGALAAHLGVERLRDRLVRMNAFTSRRGLNTPEAIATRLSLLTGGLRRQVPATYAFSSLWSEMLTAKIGEDGEQKLEKLAEGVNACLGPGDHIVPGKEEEIDRALTAYRDAVAAAVGPDIATIDMLLKAVPAVAERVRSAAPRAEG